LWFCWFCEEIFPTEEWGKVVIHTRNHGFYMLANEPTPKMLAHVTGFGAIHGFWVSSSTFRSSLRLTFKQDREVAIEVRRQTGGQEERSIILALTTFIK
jgi:hypothetical protein